jgi:hypothetical protein
MSLSDTAADENGCGRAGRAKVAHTMVPEARLLVWTWVLAGMTVCCP